MVIDSKEKFDVGGKEEWRKYPEYLADCGALFGAGPQLKCVDCKKADYELFHGHCKVCAIKKGVPRNMAKPEEFHEAVEKGETIVVKPTPKCFLPWWHLRRWFSKKS